MEIRDFPKIPKENNISDIKTYLVRLDRKLKSFLSETEMPQSVEKYFSGVSGGKEETFFGTDIENLKNDIIRTAKEIEYLRDNINLTLTNNYVAKSDVGKYTEEAVHKIEIDGKGITSVFKEVSSLTSRVDNAEKDIGVNTSANSALQENIKKTEAYIRTGKLDNGVYGIEIGNFTSGDICPYKVRMSDNRLGFYIGNTEVAYFSDSSMYVKDTKILDNLSIGDNIIKNNDGITITCGK